MHHHSGGYHSAMFSKPRILIVEDESGIADTIQYVLATDGFAPVWCATAEQALARVRGPAAGTGHPGRGPARPQRLRAVQAAAGAARRRSGAHAVPHRAQRRDRPRRRAGAGRRRLHRQALLAARTGGAGAHHPAPQRPARTGRDRCAGRTSLRQPFALDEERRQIRYYGRLLELSRYEYGILRLLVQKPGRVFTRDELLDKVWDGDSDSFDRTVDAHIKTLRAKLKAVAPRARGRSAPCAARAMR